MNGRRPPDDVRRATWRLGIQIGLVVLACVLAVTGIVVVSVVRSQQAQTAALLDEAIATTRGGGGPDRDSDDVRLRQVSVAVTDPYGARTVGTMPTGLPDRAVMDQVSRTGATEQRTMVIDGRHYAVRTAHHGDDTVQAVLDLGEQRAEIARLVQAILLAGLTGFVLAATAATWLARRAVRPIADALALQRRFVADASHELRTPLTLLSTRAQLLVRRLRARDGADDAVLTDAEGLVADTRNLTDILEDLLVAADARTPVPDTPVDLAALAREAVAAANPYAREHQVRLNVNTSTDTVIPAGARTALLRATTAVLDNAIEHASRQVQLSVLRDGADVLVQVRDDGPGIANDVMPTMFSRESSHRGTGTATRRHYGLGLALVAEIVAKHGGRLTAANVAGAKSGAELTMRLPRKR